MSNATKQKIKLMKAWLKGKQIQIRQPGHKWMDMSTVDPVWDWATAQYRIKPAPPLELWVNVYSENAYITYASKSEAEAAADTAEAIHIALHMKEV